MKVASTPATSSFRWVRKSPMYLSIYPPFFLFAARSLAEWDVLIIFSRLSNFPYLLVKLSRCFPSSPSIFFIVSHLQAPRLCCLFQSTLASIRRISSQRAFSPNINTTSPQSKIKHPLSTENIEITYSF